MHVHILNQQQDLTLSTQNVDEIVRAVLSKEGKTCDEITIHFVDTETICALHAQYFNDPSATDCISFPIDSADQEGYCVLGEVFVCPRTAMDYGIKHQVDPYLEATLYIVHGILHLLGYDDIGDEEPRMREAEKRHMKNLADSNLILTKE